MINLAVYNVEGKEIDNLRVDEAALGGSVRHALLKQAIVMYHANRRIGTAATKSRSMVAGSTKKLFRQKGTGNARVGNIRTGKRRGGGMIFAKSPRDFSQRMPKKQKRLARDSAILAKLLGNNVVVVDGLKFDEPKTKNFVSVLANLKIDRSCLVTMDAVDENVLKSARNVPKVVVMPVSELNAFEICSCRKMLFTKDALLSVLSEDEAS
ncbi:50S ribosomal protein L4 [Planctomycetota bacterium]